MRVSDNSHNTGTHGQIPFFYKKAMTTLAQKNSNKKHTYGTADALNALGPIMTFFLLDYTRWP